MVTQRQWKFLSFTTICDFKNCSSKTDDIIFTIRRWFILCFNNSIYLIRFSVIHFRIRKLKNNRKNIRKNTNHFFKNLTLIMDNNTSKNDMTVYENIKFWKNIFLSSIQDSEIDSLLEMLLFVRNHLSKNDVIDV